MRKKRLLLSVGASLYKQMAYIIMGLILPRLIIYNYGSSVNGLVNSITQFLGYISMLEMGVSAVVSSSLYLPLSKNDMPEVSKIMVASKRFYRKIAGVLILYSISLVFLYPVLIDNQFDFGFTATLIAAIAVNLFVQYYFGISNTILLNADQKAYIPCFASGTTVLINLLISYVLIVHNVSIQVLQLATSLIYILRPIIYCIYVKRGYDLDYHIHYKENPIKQRKSGILHHLAFSLFQNTDIVVLTVFSTLKAVSVYSVYFYVVNAVVGVIQTATSNITALLGNLLSQNEMQQTKEFFEFYTWFMHFITVILFSTMGCLIIPFIRLYTFGLNDTNYIEPLFAYLLILSYAVYVIRLPYNQIIIASGRYKDTQLGAVVEAVLNLVISIVLVVKYGLIGVALGTLIAMLWRTIDLIQYLSKNILFISIPIIIKNIMIDILIVFINSVIAYYFQVKADSYIIWGIYACIVLIIFLCVGILINLLFNKKYFIQLKKYFFNNKK